ncbi:murein L,D-transpeptidase [Aminipila butyrica]|uniref:Murein L,D-transpeptidase n=1 Tax=Aminipila butyrica TaxID=433296 RepID=A0A858BTQ6_9FIRM|nr:L,D-transpeptidase [Aminipila butyrica]QIB68458.1 murein L,D-transpeptidase [Aminipila butyrica]
MKHFNLLLTALCLAVVFVFLLILGPDVEKARLDKESGTPATGDAVVTSDQETEEAALVSSEEAGQEESKALSYGFNLKYDKYLVERPYTYIVNGEKRYFQFNLMRQRIDTVEKAMGSYRMTYIDNYKNRNGQAPQYKGRDVDPQGGSRGASAPAYPDIRQPEEFIYLADGTLVQVLEEDQDFTLVGLVGTDAEFSVPNRYIPQEDGLISLKKVIIVDRKNQNIATFEKEGESWNITSYSKATTGKEGRYHQLTPLGYYFAIEKKPKFYYLKDGTDQIEGYAPYAVRFTAGAYTHGVSSAYTYTADGGRLDPGIHEFSSSIGTVPLSHKCVRNYTSHAKFIYDWYEHGSTIVIVIE